MLDDGYIIKRHINQLMSSKVHKRKVQFNIRDKQDQSSSPKVFDYTQYEPTNQRLITNDEELQSIPLNVDRQKTSHTQPVQYQPATLTQQSIVTEPVETPSTSQKETLVETIQRKRNTCNLKKHSHSSYTSTIFNE